MAYDGKLLAKANAALADIREANRAERERRIAFIHSRYPEIAETDRALSRQMSELVRLAFSKSDTQLEDLKALQDSNLRLQEERASALEAHGFARDYLDEIYSCPVCRDTGMDGNRVCSCLKRLYNAEVTKMLGTLLKNDESFGNFDLGLYSDEFDSSLEGSPREYMSDIRDICVSYAENFRDDDRNLYFFGPTGVGKTYLSACVARAVAGSGFSVCYESCGAAFDIYETKRFSRDSEAGDTAASKWKRMLDCDLMILDDLGTEVVTSVTQSALYELINTRLINGRKTIISSNIRPADIGKKYGPQIASRINGEFVAMPFAGDDIRLRKK